MSSRVEAIKIEGPIPGITAVAVSAHPLGAAVVGNDLLVWILPIPSTSRRDELEILLTLGSSEIPPGWDWRDYLCTVQKVIEDKIHFIHIFTRFNVS